MHETLLSRIQVPRVGNQILTTKTRSNPGFCRTVDKAEVSSDSKVPLLNPDFETATHFKLKLNHMSR